MQCPVVRKLWHILTVTALLAGAHACTGEPRARRQLTDADTKPAVIDISKFPDDSSTRSAILRMSFDEAAQRLGSLSLTCQTSFVFNRGGEEHEQSYTGRVTQDAAGSFHVVSETEISRVELYLIGDSVYVRQDTGNLRKKPRREASTETWRELVWSNIQEGLGLFMPTLRLLDPKPETTAGRAATRWRLALAPKGEEGVNVALASTRLPLTPTSRWRELARPLAATGNLWIDDATGVMLKLKLEGRLEVADRDVRPTQLTVRIEGTVSKPNAIGTLAVADSIKEYERTPPNADPIDFIRPQLNQAGAEVVVNARAIPSLANSPTAAVTAPTAPAAQENRGQEKSP